MGKLRRVLGRLVAGAVFVGATFVIGHLLWTRPPTPPSEVEILAALGAQLASEARRAQVEGGPLGAQLVFTPPARLEATLIGARTVREISQVERRGCRLVAELRFECAYLALGETSCAGADCALFGGDGVRRLRTLRTSVFVWTPDGWAATPLDAEYREDGTQ